MKLHETSFCVLHLWYLNWFKELQFLGSMIDISWYINSGGAPPGRECCGCWQSYTETGMEPLRLAWMLKQHPPHRYCSLQQSRKPETLEDLLGVAIPVQICVDDGLQSLVIICDWIRRSEIECGVSWQMRIWQNVITFMIVNVCKEVWTLSRSLYLYLYIYIHLYRPSTYLENVVIIYRTHDGWI
jgi:hypothetical protein